MIYSLKYYKVSPVVSTDLQTQASVEELEAIYRTPDGMKNGLVDTWATNVTGVYAESIARRTWDTFVRSPWEDIKESNNKVLTVGALSVGGATQAIDRLRYGFAWFVAQPAIDELKDTMDVSKAATVAALGFLAWNTVANESLNFLISKFPRSKEAFIRNFPLLVRVLDEATPGLDANYNEDGSRKTSRVRRALGYIAANGVGGTIETTGRVVKEAIVHPVGAGLERAKNASLATVKNIGSFALRTAGRAFVGLGVGSAPFVGMTRAKGRSYIEATKQNLKAGISTTAAVYWIAAGAGQYIIDHPEDAQDVMDALKNKNLWLAIGLGAMAVNYVINRRKKQKIIKEEGASPRLEIPQ